MYWFHWPSVLKMPTLSRPGLAMGSITRKNTPVCEHPSMKAASAYSAGSDRKNECMKNTVNGSEYAT